MGCRFSFTSDLWSNKGRDRGFMAITCHYIDDNWILRKKIITFVPLPSPHTGKHIAQSFYDKIVMWNLDKRAFCLVLDNASSNDACIKELFASTSIKDDLPVQGKLFHQRCGCHILNLIVQDGLGTLDDEINGVRNTMKHIRHSQARMEKFKLACSQVNVPYKQPAWDVPTRWNSTYLMLELALELKQAICRYASLDKRYNIKISDFQWGAVHALVAELKVFYGATLKLSGTKYPTLNLFFTEFCEVLLTIKKMATSPYPFIVQMGTDMLDKFDKYWTIGNSLLAIATVLDPRCKIAVVEYYMKELCPETCDLFINNLRNCMKEMFDEYVEANADGASNQNQDRLSKSQKTGASTTHIISNTRAGLKDYIKEKKTSDAPKSELDEYLGSDLDQASVDEEFDILTWWKMKVPKYPVLSRLARDILAVPISTVASESAFSTSGRVLSPVRNSLSDESIEALLCAQDWLRASITENGEHFGETLWTNEGCGYEG
ncbi:Zinc finger BED domain-containing protein DAYSLEEPER [Rhynchospora pubera]|uniref:Zinc finger BED domain-containing protein DAYSLEEPER n=1 Tax=Rhynchospora pubera TaxID=906938 RepID=A0AAV8EVY6_9POAL|nr:Zinc finger BED domain-containing protein DAYSLEEPER [Rhynchospora pubera]